MIYSKNKENNIYITLSEASKISGISRDYLNVLIHREKLRAIKIGKNWLTTKAWISECKMPNHIIRNQGSEYLSLFNAAKIANVSSGYLNVAVRRGKLRAVKLGRNWFTTSEWLSDYQKSVGRGVSTVAELRSPTSEVRPRELQRSDLNTEVGLQTQLAKEDVSFEALAKKEKYELRNLKSGLILEREKALETKSLFPEIKVSSRKLKIEEKENIIEAARFESVERIKNQFKKNDVSNFEKVSRSYGISKALKSWSYFKFVAASGLAAIVLTVSLGFTSGLVPFPRYKIQDTRYKFQASIFSDLVKNFSFDKLRINPGDLPAFSKWLADSAGKSLSLLKSKSPSELVIESLEYGKSKISVPEEFLTPINTFADAEALDLQTSLASETSPTLPYQGGERGEVLIGGGNFTLLENRLSSVEARLNEQLALTNSELSLQRKTILGTLETLIGISKLVPSYPISTFVVQGQPATLTTYSVSPSVHTGFDRLNASYLSLSNNATINGSLTVKSGGTFDTLSVSGNTTLTGNATIGGTLDITGDTTLNNLNLNGVLTLPGSATLGNASSTYLTVSNTAWINQLRVTGTATTTFNNPITSFSGNFIVAADSANNILLNPYGGNVGIGTSSPNNLLTIAGATTPSLGLTTNSGLSGWTVGIDTDDANKFKIASSTAVGTNVRLTIDGAGNVGIGTTSPGSLFSVHSTGNTYLGGALTVSGTVNFQGDTSFSNGFTLSGILTQTASSTSSIISSVASSTATHYSFDARGAGPIFNILKNNSSKFYIDNLGNVGVATTTFPNRFGFNVATSTFVYGNQFISGGLGVGLSTTTSGAIQTSGDVFVGRNLFVSGSSVTLGASTADSLTINSSINSNLIPDVNAVRDLGSSAFYWDDAFIDTLTVNNLSAASSSVAGTQAETFTINSDNNSADAQNAEIIFYRGTVVPNALFIWNSATSSKRFEMNQVLYINNGSASTTNPSLTIQGIANQTADLLKLTNPGSSNLFTVSPYGAVNIATSTYLSNFGLNVATSTNIFGSLRVGTSSLTLNSGNIINDVGQFNIVNTANSNLTFYTNNSERMRIDNSGNVGIASTSPSAVLSVNVSNATGVANALNITSATSSLLYVRSDGNVGIGTTTPITTFAVNGNGYFGSALGVGILNTTANTFRVGQCVTGDTRLRRRIGRRKKKDGSYEDIFEDVRIDEIKSGDEILTLDDKSGQLKVSRVKKLAYMGKKPIIELTTAIGRKIRTTGNHPYFVREASLELPRRKPKIGIFFDNANMFYAQRDAGWTLDVHVFKKALAKYFDVAFLNYYIAIPEKHDAAYERTLSFMKHIEDGVTFKTKTLKYIKTAAAIEKKGDMDVEIALDVTKTVDDLDAVLIVSGDSDLLPLRKYVIERGKKIAFVGFKLNTAWELAMGGKYAYLDGFRSEIALGENKTPEPKLGVALLSLLYSQPPSLSSGGVWIKVSALKEGQEIAVVGNNGKPVWDKITQLNLLSEEEVYDVEIENTHNFVGNGIIAHNTAFIVDGSGNVGIGTAGPGTNLHITENTADVVGQIRIEQSGTGDAGLEFRIPTSRIWAMGIDNSDSDKFKISNDINTADVGVDTRLTIDGSGNVGIGTTSPGQLLSVNGNGFFAGNLNVASSTTLLNASTTHLSVSGSTFLGNATTTGLSVNGGTLLNSLSFGAATGTSLTVTGGTKLGAIDVNNGTLITVGGNVGIGTTNPESHLNIVGASSPRIIISPASQGTARSTLRLGIDTSSNIAFVDSNNGNEGTNRPLGFFIEGVEGMRLDTNRNVGIGTTSPNNLLSISSATTPAVGFTTATGFGWTVGMDTADSNKFKIASSTAVGTNVRFTIDGAGNVGIGTAGPSQKLVVSGSTGSNNNMIVAEDVGVPTRMVMWAANGEGHIGTRTNHPTIFEQNQVEKMRIDTSGNVGIASTSPSAVLSVNVSNATGVANAFNITSATSSLLYVRSDGNVGIGTANPAGRLGLPAGSLATPSISWGSGLAGIYNDGANRIHFVGNGTDNAFIDNTPNFRMTSVGVISWTDGTISGTVDTNLYRGAANQLKTDSALVVAGTGNSSIAGNVGIGTTSPNNLLTITATTTPALGFTVRSSVDNGQSGWTLGVDTADSNKFKIASSTAVGTNVRFTIDGAGNVGIASSSPSAVLSVNVSNATGVANALNITSATSSLLYVRSDGNVGINTTTPTSTLSILGTLSVKQTSGAESLFVNSSGSVGIGTAGPTTKLYVDAGTTNQDGILITGNSDNVQLNLYNTKATATAGKNYEIVSTAATSGWGGGNLAFVDATVGAARMVINNAGNVGIASTSPNALLSVNVSANGTSTQAFNITTATSSLFMVNSHGKVGIASTSPWGILSVNIPDNTATGGGPPALAIRVPNTYGNGIGLNINSATSSLLYVRSDGNVGINTTTPTSTLSILGTLSVKQTSGAESLFVNSSGNVGIGTVTPGTEGLEIAKASADVGWRVRRTGTGVSTFVGVIDGSGDARINVETANALILYTNGAERLRILSGGNVGIASTSPSAVLSVNVSNATGVANAFNITSATSSLLYVRSDGNVGINTTTPTSTLSILGTLSVKQTSGAESLFVNSSGNVGIGTAGPLGLLHVSKAGDNQVFIQDTGSTAAALRLSIGTISADQAPTDWLLQAVGSDGRFRIFQQSATQGERFTILEGGNVGIGTTSPNNLLTISSATTPAVGFTTATGFGWTVGMDTADSNKFKIASSTAVGTNVRFTIDGTGNVGIASTSPSAVLSVNVSNATGDAAALNITSATTSLLFVRSDGSVGVGTTTPGLGVNKFKFVVQGNASFAGCVGFNAAPNSGTCVDVAESYPTSESLEAGDIVQIKSQISNLKSTSQNSNLLIEKATSTSQNIIGIISTNPGILLNGYDTVFGGISQSPNSSTAPVALAGRVPVKVSLENGPIMVGDRITASSVAGVGMRATATTTAATVGMALEAFDGTTPSSTSDVGVTLTSDVIPGVGKILVFVNLGQPSLAAKQGTGELSDMVTAKSDLNMNGFALINVKSISGLNNLWKIDENGNIIAQSVETQKLTVGGGAASGVTIYDRTTATPKCIYIEGGVVKTSDGTCGTTTNAGTPAEIIPTSDSVGSPTSQPAEVGLPLATTTPTIDTMAIATTTESVLVEPVATTTEPILTATSTIQ